VPPRPPPTQATRRARTLGRTYRAVAVTHHPRDRLYASGRWTCAYPTGAHPPRYHPLATQILPNRYGASPTSTSRVIQHCRNRIVRPRCPRNHRDPCAPTTRAPHIARRPSARRAGRYPRPRLQIVNGRHVHIRLSWRPRRLKRPSCFGHGKRPDRCGRPPLSPRRTATNVGRHHRPGMRYCRGVPGKRSNWAVSTSTLSPRCRSRTFTATVPSVTLICRSVIETERWRKPVLWSYAPCQKRRLASSSSDARSTHTLSPLVQGG